MFVLFCVLHRVSLNRPSCPRTQDADQADLEFRDLTVSTSRVLGLKACSSWRFPLVGDCDLQVPQAHCVHSQGNCLVLKSGLHGRPSQKAILENLASGSENRPAIQDQAVSVITPG